MQVCRKLAYNWHNYCDTLNIDLKKPSPQGKGEKEEENDEKHDNKNHNYRRPVAGVCTPQTRRAL